MKHILPGLILIALLANGCKKNDDNNSTSPGGVPAPTASFKITNMVDANHILEGKNLQLENTSKNVVSCSWDFGNGEHYEGKTPVGIYYVPCGGNYTITLTTKNSDGKTATYSQSFLVNCSGKMSHGMHLPD